MQIVWTYSVLCAACQPTTIYSKLHVTSSFLAIFPCAFLLYASTRVRFHFVLRHSRHLSVTTISLSYVPFIIVYHRLSVFRLSSFSSLRIYSAPVMFRASFLGFVAALPYFNIFTFLWLDNKFIVFVIL